MSEQKSFWTSIPGVATGVVGFVSAVVGVSAQFGWIGGDGGGGGGAPVTTTLVGEAGTTGSTVRGATATPPSVVGEFVVEPMTVSFEPLQARESIVTVRNVGDVPLTMRAPTVTGSGSGNFKANDLSCTRSPLAAGRSCEVKVTFTPQGAGQFTAVLVVATPNLPRAVEVTLKGNAPLG